MQFRSWCRMCHVALFAAAFGLVACDMKPAEGNGRTVRKASKASIATFDTSKLDFDIMSVGSERPDEYMTQQAWENSFSAFDECVADEKSRVNSEKQIPGDITLTVRLHPEGKPIGVNADGPKGLLKREKLVNCMREAAATAPFPKYDGPPVETEMTLEVDPGFE